MKQFDQYHRTLPISGRQRVIVLLDVDPDSEYLLKVKYLDTGRESRLNKEEIIKKWKSAQSGVQSELFKIDQTKKYRRIYSTK